MRRSRSRCWSKSSASARGRRRGAGSIRSVASPGVLSMRVPIPLIRAPEKPGPKNRQIRRPVVQYATADYNQAIEKSSHVG